MSGWRIGGSEILNYCEIIVLISYALGDQKIWISHRRKAWLVHSVFHMKLYILVKWDVLSLVDLTEHLLFSFQLAKIFGNTTFVSIKYQCSSEFFQIGMPHFSLEGVTALIWRKFLPWYFQCVFSSERNALFCSNSRRCLKWMFFNVYLFVLHKKFCYKNDDTTHVSHLSDAYCKFVLSHSVTL